MTSQDRHQATADDLDVLLAALPPEIVEAIHALPDRESLIEVVLDLGRPPEARYPSSEVTLLEREVTERDIAHVVEHIGSFGDDNRAGIERTLHRISAIRNRNGKIVGLTCRIGRAVYGTIEIIADFVETGKSILIMGRPGIGKTTMLREAARVLADEQRKRVVVVDTSNEIAGDGDIPHPAIGKARRMQVRTPSLQHEVMIEAVENHMPQVIVIDEIGTELEAQAARTIAERGVQLIGTAHGNNLDNLMLNPTLSDLIGGIQSVTLGDEEARRRRSQKSVLERKAPPTFDVIVEIQDRERVLVHSDVAQTVDAMLLGEPVAPELPLARRGGRPPLPVAPQAVGPRRRRRGTGRPVQRPDRGRRRRLGPRARLARRVHVPHRRLRRRGPAAVATRVPARASRAAGGRGAAVRARLRARDALPGGRPIGAAERHAGRAVRRAARRAVRRRGDRGPRAARAGRGRRRGQRRGAGPRRPRAAPPGGLARRGRAGPSTRSTRRRAPGRSTPTSSPAPRRSGSPGWSRARTTASTDADDDEAAFGAGSLTVEGGTLPTLRVFPHGISRKRLEQAIRDVGLPVLIAREPDEADVAMTLRSEYRQKPPALRDAEDRGIPIYVLKANTIAQMQASLASVFALEVDPREAALRETEQAIGLVIKQQEPVELAPQNAYIRRLQHQMAERANLVSRSRGREPYRRVRLYPDAARPAWR